MGAGAFGVAIPHGPISVGQTEKGRDDEDGSRWWRDSTDAFGLALPQHGDGHQREPLEFQRTRESMGMAFSMCILGTCLAI